MECEADFAQSKQENKISVAGGELMIAFSFGPFFIDYQKNDQNTNVELNNLNFILNATHCCIYLRYAKLKLPVCCSLKKRKDS